MYIYRVNRILKKLNEPFPEQSSFQSNLRFMLGTGGFVTAFLYFFRPFGLSAYPGDLLWLCAGFGMVTTATALLYDTLLPLIFNWKKDLPSWTLWKWTLNTIFLIIVIGIANHLYMSYTFGWQGLTWQNLSWMIFNTFLVGIFPVLFAGMLIQMRAYKRHRMEAQQMQSTLVQQAPSPNLLKLYDHNNNLHLEMPADQLFYIEAMQNYVSVCFTAEKNIQRTMIRNTIRQIEVQVAGTAIIRCHRSYLVNTNLIEQVEGNAQGLRLSLQGLPAIEIPVSRKYIPLLKSILST